MSSKFKVFKESLVSFFSRQTFKRLYERVRYNNMSKKQRIAFICLITIIPSVAILIGILTSCIYGIDYHSVAIGVNQSTQRFIGQTTWSNQVVFLSLATSLKKFPNGYFQISFGDNNAQGVTNYASIPARSSEGTPLKVDLFVKGKLRTSNYTAFYMKYGDDWQFYLRQKIPNAVIRSISQKGFYDLKSSEIKQQIGQQLAQFQQFTINIVSLQIKFPNNYINSTSGTIGWNVFQRQAQLTLLKQSNLNLNTFITQNNNLGEFQNYGTLKAAYEKIIIDNSIYVNTTDSLSNWQKGMTALSGFATTSAIQNQILWYYFQSYYNSSFNTQPHRIQFN